MRRALAFLASTLAVAAACIPGCIPHPSDDFKDYEDKTAEARKVTPQEAGPPPDATAPVKPLDGVYFGTCFSQLANGRTDRVLRFYTETKFVPSPTGGAITLAIKTLKLPTTPTDAKTGTFGKDNTVGQTFTASDNPVDSKGVFTAPLATVQVPGEANPISGRDIVINETQFKGRFADPAKFCAQLSGKVVQPVDVTLEGPANICLFIAAKEGDIYPDPPKEEYVCNVD